MFHTCARRGDGAVKCWGANTYGQLGLGDTDSRGGMPNQMGDNLPALDLGPGRTPVGLVGGGNHACALLDDHSVKCWGQNLDGQLGVGDKKDRGDDPGEMGDNLPAVDLGAGRTAISVSAGWSHTCALLDDHSVKCWGRNVNGQLGLGDMDFRGTGPNQMGDDLDSVDFGPDRFAIAISCGLLHTCAVLDDDSLRCWGMNTYGQLGLGDPDARGDEPGEMGDALDPVTLGDGRSVAILEAGAYQTCVVLDDGALKCWGYNGVGGLGLGDPDNRGDEPGEMGDDLPAVDLGLTEAVRSLSSDNATCAVFADARMKCFGFGFDGELGIGESGSRGDEPGEMGEDLPFVDVGAGRTVLAATNGGATPVLCSTTPA
jgi:alpha-tubulin suppressor-like RCC1 family protein